MADEAPVEVGRPGASLDGEYRRRKQAREERIRGKHPRLGGLILALSEEPASTRAFATGAEGERRIADRLEKDCGTDVLFLHNRRLGHGRRDGDVDHIAIAPSGIYIIDAKRYRNAAVRVRRTGGLFSPAREQLMVGGRDRSKLIDGSLKQLAAVLTALGDDSEANAVPVTAVLCFIDADLPLWGDQEMRGVRLLGPRGTSKLVRRPGDITASRRRSLHRHLAAALPPA
ncbi:nuclease-related domain-containing protein [Terrabacter lapilli]|uniref:nuclease-related domain-containing protein n=1 Tax=Terrabacter lapilli TaxID=436231 RepID=UPI0031D5C0BD